MTAIHLGRDSRRGSVPPTRRLMRAAFQNNADASAPLTPAYLVLLRVEIARFTRPPLFRGKGRLVSVALILTSRWRAVSSCAALCSPDLPPVRPFGGCTSGGLAGSTAGLSHRPVFRLPQDTRPHGFFTGIRASSALCASMRALQALIARRRSSCCTAQRWSC